MTPNGKFVKLIFWVSVTLTLAAMAILLGFPSMLQAEEVEGTTIVSRQDEIKNKITRMALTRGVNPEIAIAIVRCESSFRPGVKNPNSTASGLFQFIRGTWKGSLKQMDLPAELDVFDGDANIMVGLWLLEKEGTRPWNASKHCWSKEVGPVITARI